MYKEFLYYAFHAGIPGQQSEQQSLPVMAPESPRNQAGPSDSAEWRTVWMVKSEDLPACADFIFPLATPALPSWP